MKKSLLFHILADTLSIFSWIPASGQWSLLDLSSPQAKIPASRNSSFSVCFTTGFPLGSGPSTRVDLLAIQNAANTPGTREQLFEKLGGAFFIGSFSGQKSPEITLAGQAHPMPGVQLGFRPGRRLECQAGIRYFRSEWSGEFPVSVIPFGNSKPETITGTAHASAVGMSVEAGGAFFISKGSVQPMIKGGVRGLFTIRAESEMTVSGVVIPLALRPAGTSLSPYAGAGVRVNMGSRILLDTVVSWGKLPGGDYSAALGLGFGWKF